MPTKKDCFKDCKDCPVFAQSVFYDLSDSALDKIKGKKNVSFFKRGQSLFVEKTPAFGLYCIGEGNFKISKMSEEGKDSIIRIATAGNITGHRSIFSNQPFQATATALSESHVCFLDKTFILELIDSEPHLARNFLFQLSRDLGLSEKNLASFSQHNVRERVAGLLLFLEEQFGNKSESGTSIEIKLSREEMASLIGTATETLIRFLSELKDEKIIEQRGKSLVILDHERLEEFAAV
ncbi:MAG: Crp/Fnr family transcriptional regulator [Halobacteriovoraceae bacterium]|nr:Crp/Fnr family transcriptional regulator [Halobacteriovoraceae bacterium]MBT5093360.1 Crp/Fnr family transcriptional regulator [Halobacteriovoraceae bacterium]